MKPLLILDLDETLVHAAEVPLARPADFQVAGYHVYVRPFLDDFLHQVEPWFSLAIWSSASDAYVQEVARDLGCPKTGWEFVWAQDKCTRTYCLDEMDNYFVKDLKKVKRLGYQLSQVLIADDTPKKVRRHYGNAIYMPAFTGEADDRILPLLARYVTGLVGVANFRQVEKRGWWRSR